MWPTFWKASSSRTRKAGEKNKNMQTIQLSIYVLGFLVVLALLFDFLNGFHDAANAIATVVSTGVLKPHQAVALAALFNFVAIFVFHVKVASTVGKGTV